MPSTNFIRRHHAVVHYVSFAPSFDFFCFRLSIVANCSCCCCVILFHLCFPCFTFCLRCGIICGGGLFNIFSMISLLFFRAQASRLQCFFCLVAFIILNRLLFSCILDMAVLSRQGDHESSHDTSVVTSHVDHVVALVVFSVSQISSLGQSVVNFSFLWRNEGRLCLMCFPVNRVECCVTL